MKKKDSSDVIEALKIMFKSSKETPIIIMSDNDSTFLSDEVQTFLESKDVILQVNILGDHNALGIIDNMAKRIKGILGKYMLRNKIDDWTSEIHKRINIYNKSPHMALLGLSPIEAEEENNFTFIYQINAKKSLKNKTVSDLNINDLVRINIKGKFTKSSEPQFSDKFYKVTEIKGNNIILDNGETKKRSSLLLIPPDTKLREEPNLIKVATKKKKSDNILKKEDIEISNVVREARIRKAPDRLNI